MRWRGLISVLSLLALTSVARAEVPQASYIEVDASQADIVEPTGVSTNLLYLNRCEGGCTITAGYDDSRANRSSIVSGTAQISEFGHGDVTWNAVVDCVNAMYEPFDVVVTDEDPGDQAHFEAIVAGRPGDIGAQNGVGGVAPFSCGVINNAITFSFANIYGSAQQICHTVAQESAHAFGLDHEYLCEDPMTYLQGCGPKTFQDQDAQCGEFQARSCRCGGSTQNSVERIMNVFGPSEAVPPEVEIVRPKAGAAVKPGFPIEVEATDDISVEKVEFYVNSQKIGEATLKPFVQNAPAMLDEGNLMVEARAIDNRGAVGTAKIEVMQGDPCKSASDCGGDKTCVDGRCVPGPGTQGGLGEPCDGNGDCASGLCGSGAEGERFCAEECSGSGSGCPGGFKCTEAGEDLSVCWPSEDSGGCAAGGNAPKAPFALALLLGLVALRRRRRS